MARGMSFKDRFSLLLYILDGNDYSAEHVSKILGCTVQRARDFIRNDLDIRRENFYKNLIIFAEEQENIFS